MAENIDRPIFILGSGRSGTTILLKLLAGHNHLGWFSNYTRRYPGWPELAYLNKLYQTPALVKHFKSKRWFPIPAEAPMLWDIYHPLDNSSSSPPLTEKQAGETDVEGLKLFLASMLRYSASTRIIIKDTRFSRRIRYLQAIFNDSLFIHIVRDGRAVTNSLLNVDWWHSLPLWWADGKTPAQLNQEGYEQTQIAARAWKTQVERTLIDKEWIPKGQYMEIRYEKLMEDPVTETKRLLDFCDLPWVPGFRAHIEALNIESKDYKWAERFTSQQLAAIEEEIYPLLEQLEYR